ncbi:hypothetical protein HC248_00858 [Polaromonas vacuolata]|uniref:Uncharacterized protein n=1 Tax=Polaromonas vacuolata TaxID=37448 RepID=A0A6H2H734_9BURK|nr:hypothetical protein HC248_00858 [Polaromonas vacuolata]
MNISLIYDRMLQSKLQLQQVKKTNHQDCLFTVIHAEIF